MNSDINPVFKSSNLLITGTVAVIAILILVGFIFG